MDKILVRLCGFCGPIDDELYEEYFMAGECIEHTHGDSDTGHRLQAELDARYDFKIIVCPQCYHAEGEFDFDLRQPLKLAHNVPPSEVRPWVGLHTCALCEERGYEVHVVSLLFLWG